MVRFGTRAGKAEYVASWSLAYATPVALWALGLSGWQVLLPLLSLPLAWPPARVVFTQTGAQLNAGLGGVARLLLAFGFLFALGLYGGAR